MKMGPDSAGKDERASYKLFAGLGRDVYC